jgi:hypothetical protein
MKILPLLRLRGPSRYPVIQLISKLCGLLLPEPVRTFCPLCQAYEELSEPF